MQSRIHGIRLKIERAQRHINDLEVELHAFFDRDPYKIATRPHPALSTHYTLYIESIEPMPDLFALLIGDAVHNLRTALDHLAWQLVEAGGGRPNKDTYFPICIGAGGPQQYASAIGKGGLHNMPSGAEPVLRAVQPHNTGDDTLSHIHQLDIMDKHHLVIPVYGVPSAWGLKKPRVWFTNVGFGKEVEAGDELFNIPIDTYENANGNIDFGFYIAFAKPEIIKGKSVLETLTEMAVFVDKIVRNFEPFM
jgi:hypothetical protein